MNELRGTEKRGISGVIPRGRWPFERPTLVQCVGHDSSKVLFRREAVAHAGSVPRRNRQPRRSVSPW
jgi:hypothetical protein